MNIKIIIYILSRFMLICALLLIIPLLVTVIYGENLILAFSGSYNWNVGSGYFDGLA